MTESEQEHTKHVHWANTELVRIEGIGEPLRDVLLKKLLKEAEMRDEIEELGRKVAYLQQLSAL